MTPKTSRHRRYGRVDAMIGTFLRLDIPVLGFVDDFVLYTDVDVLFLQARRRRRRRRRARS